MVERRWAVRLVESQIATLDRFDWKDWEIRGGNLYNNELHYRYCWAPARGALPAHNVLDSYIPWHSSTDNLALIEVLKRPRNSSKPLELLGDHVKR